MRQSALTSLLAALPATTMAMTMPTPPAMTNTTEVPKHFGILLHSSITPIDLFGPLDVFGGLAMAYVGYTGQMRLSVLSVNSTPATTNVKMHDIDFGMDLVPTITLEEYLKAAATNFTNVGESSTNMTGCHESSKIPGPIDVLLVPGGGGTRQDVSHEVDFVKTIYPSLQHIISVCTGSTILAKAGVLDGKRATTNKKAWAWATSFGKNVDYVPRARWVQDGNIWTGSGVSAAIDTAYAFVAGVYGEAAAQYVADNSEYTRWKDASYDPFADRWNVTGAVPTAPADPAQPAQPAVTSKAPAMTHDEHMNMDHSSMTHDEHVNMDHGGMAHDEHMKMDHTVTAQDKHMKMVHSATTKDEHMKLDHSAMTHDEHVNMDHGGMTHDEHMSMEHMNHN